MLKGLACLGMVDHPRPHLYFLQHTNRQLYSRWVIPLTAHIKFNSNTPLRSYICQHVPLCEPRHHPSCPTKTLLRRPANRPSSAPLQHKTLDVITLFHRPALAPSTRALNLLKQLSAQSSTTATEDQAADHAHQNRVRADWELNVTEDAPTGDQVRSILEFVGEAKAGQVVEGAMDAKEAMRRVAEDAKRFKPPIVSAFRRG